MAPLSGTQVDMWQAVLRDTRNGRKLIPSVRVALEKCFVDKGTTAGEVDTTPMLVGPLGSSTSSLYIA